MEYKQLHLLEKTQVLLTTGVLLGVVYFGIGWWFRPADPLGPIALLPSGGIGKLLGIVVVLLVLAAAAAVTTTRSRPEGAVMVALFGLGGVAMLSGPMQTLLWSYTAPIRSLYLQMIGEVLILAIGIMLGEGLAGLVRSSIARIRPTWLWTNRLGGLSDQQRKALKESEVDPKLEKIILSGDFLSVSSGMRNTLLWNLLTLPSHAGNINPAQKKAFWAQLRRGLGCLFSGVLGGIILLVLLMQSTERGQILFALFVGFILAAMFAHHLFPVRTFFVAWMMPILTAVLFYALAVISGTGNRPQYQALPIDWLTAGAGGAILGFWISGRRRETNIFETLDQLQEAT
ncbi:MAG: hypothetical protein KAJ01_01845 [Candidatus Hydrogenedentes bacterium]|nr:hypothetical protein [Candidatus Hydrogenedentota bacterium]